jgi:putative ABC transport system permease protein
LQLRARVYVLGSESKEKLFSGRFPLGEKIRISGIPYEVIGVLKPRPQEGTENSINRVVYIPFPNALISSCSSCPKRSQLLFSAVF